MSEWSSRLDAHERGERVLGAAVAGDARLLTLALESKVLSEELDLVRLRVAAKEVIREVAGAVGHGAGAGEVSAGSGSALLVVKVLVGSRLQRKKKK